MPNRTVAIVLLHCSSNFDSTLDSGGQAARVSATECLMDLSRAEDDEGWHTGIGNINIIL
jgi:hypothetical protein